MKDPDFKNLLEELEQYLGEQPVEIRRSPLGRVNSVFIARSQRHHIVVRVPQAQNGMEEILRNKWCAEQVLQLGVPASRVIGAWAGSHPSLCAGMEEYLPGTPLSSAWEGIQDRSAIFAALAAVLRKIHQVRVKGFGRLNGSGEGPHETWSEFILEVSHNPWYTWESILGTGILEHNTFVRAIELLEHISEELSTREARLLHGDFSFDNILIDSGTVTGIVDWGDAKGGDPVYDLARFEFTHGTRLFQRLCAAYFIHEAQAVGWSNVMDCYRLRISMAVLNWHYQRKDWKGMKCCSEIIHEVLARDMCV